MAYMHRQALIVCSPESAVRNLARYVAQRSCNDQVVITLRPAVHLPELPADIALGRDIIVRIKPAGVVQRYSVSWCSNEEPEPRFEGSIAIGTDSDDQTSRLILEGEMAEPTSPVSYRIVQATARDLLAHLAHNLIEINVK